MKERDDEMSNQDPAPPAGQAPAGTPAEQADPNAQPNTPPPAAPNPDPDKGEEFDKDRAMDTIKKLRGFEKLSKDQTKELEELRKKVKEADDAKLGEQERLQKRVTELETEKTRLEEERKTLVVRSAVEREARKLNLVDEDAAYQLLDLNAIEYGPDGAPTNVEDLLKKLAKDKPYLVASEKDGKGGTLPIGSTPRPDNGRALADSERTRLQVQTDRRARAAFG